MKVIFFGTPHFAADVLKYLLEHQVDVVAVITKPDKPKGRSGKLIPTPVKQVALENNIPCYQPEKISDPANSTLLQPYDADLFVVVAYGEILRQHVLDIPKKGCINLHASLLPKYRGAAPIQRAIINGEKETGVTIIHLVRKMDAGDMIKAAKLPINPDETFGEVEYKLRALGARTLLESMKEIKAGSDQRTAQDEAQVTIAPKIELENCEIDWSQSAESIHNLVRGVNPFPGAWCYVLVKGEKKRMKILKTEYIPEEEEIIQKKNMMLITCGKGKINILELQLEGKKAMSAAALLCGFSRDQLHFKDHL